MEGKLSVTHLVDHCFYCWVLVQHHLPNDVLVGHHLRPQVEVGYVTDRLEGTRDINTRRQQTLQETSTQFSVQLSTIIMVTYKGSMHARRLV